MQPAADHPHVPHPLDWAPIIQKPNCPHRKDPCTMCRSQHGPGPTPSPSSAHCVDITQHTLFIFSSSPGNFISPSATPYSHRNIHRQRKVSLLHHPNHRGISCESVQLCHTALPHQGTGTRSAQILASHGCICFCFTTTTITNH